MNHDRNPQREQPVDSIRGCRGGQAMPEGSGLMRKIKFAYIGLLIILVAIGSLAFYTYWVLEKSGNQRFVDFRNFEYALKIDAITDKEAIYVRNFLMSGEEEYLQNIIESQKDIREWKTRLDQSVVTSKGRALLANIEKLEREEQFAINHSIALRKNNGNPKFLLRYFDKEVQPRYLALQREIDLLITHKEEALQEQQSEHKVDSSILVRIIVVAGGLACIAGLLLAWLVFNTLAKIKKVELDLRNTIHSRDEFLSIASHDLKTPLTSLLLQLQIMGRSVSEWLGQQPSGKNDQAQSEFSPQSLLKAIELCVRQGKGLVKIIDDLFDLTRIRVGKLSLAPSRVDLSAIVTEVIARNHPETLQSKSEISMSTDGPIFGYWDSARLDQVLANLISNAVKYGEGKPISIRAEADREHQLARLIIEDHGMGIAPEMREKIFGRFERAVSENKIKGLGLGLYIVRQIVEAHGGSIRVESELGKGSKFIVEIPMLPTEEAPIISTTTTTLQKRDRNRILVVDDSPDIQSLLRIVFEKGGYIVDSAMNGQEALTHLRASNELPAFILLDVTMPVMDGYQFRKEQERDPVLSACPIVVMTADGNSEMKGKQIGAAVSLRKPVDFDILLDTARRFCV